MHAHANTPARCVRACLWHRALCWSWGCLGAVRRRHGCTHSAVFTPQHSLRCDTSGRLYSGPSKWMEMRTGVPMWNMNSYSNSDLTPGPSASPHPRGANAGHFDPASVHPVTARLHMHLHYSITPYLPPYSPFPYAAPVYSSKSLIRRKTDVTERRDERSSCAWELSSRLWMETSTTRQAPCARVVFTKFWSMFYRSLNP